MQIKSPVTPALSQWERGNCRQSVGESSGAGMFQGRPLLFPLLGERVRVRGWLNPLATAEL
jgi:hypothetical protein